MSAPSAIIVVLLLSVMAIGLCSAQPNERIATTRETTKLISHLFDSKIAPFSSVRHPIKGATAREDMLQFIHHELGSLQIFAKKVGLRSEIETLNFTTTIMYQNSLKPVQGHNVVFILHGTANTTQDKPLLLLANYDTASNCNQVNEGSGLVALLSLAELILDDIESRSLTLKDSIVFAFTDLASNKYSKSGHHVSDGLTGGTQIARDWLPKFLMDRKSFRGSIVLDNIMNYNDESDSQIVKDINLDKSFPSSYTIMTEGDFRGDFLGLIHRDHSLDTPLVKAIQEAWTQSLKEAKARASYVDPKLIPFVFTTDPFVSPSLNHFLESEQSAFWNQRSTAGIKEYGAVALTDTREVYRRSNCLLICEVASMKTDKNLAFMTRTVNTLRLVVLDWQTNANGALSTLTAPFSLLLAMYMFTVFYSRL